jgi:hypothetical protein
MAEMIAFDVHQVMMNDLHYAELIKDLAVATIAALASEMQVTWGSAGSTRSR